MLSTEQNMTSTVIFRYYGNRRESTRTYSIIIIIDDETSSIPTTNYQRFAQFWMEYLSSYILECVLFSIEEWPKRREMGKKSQSPGYEFNLPLPSLGDIVIILLNVHVSIYMQANYNANNKNKISIFLPKFPH